MASKIWLITGVSGGIGRALAQEVADEGHVVFGTLRKASQMDSFLNLVPGKTFPLLMDVHHQNAVDEGIDTILNKEGRIDVLVNNAGYGLFGAIEEVTMDEARHQMETNFFGALALTKAVLPAMRRQKSGHVLQISSIAGFRGTEGLGIYNASKFALEGFSQALYKEMLPFGVHVTLVEPGPFRTEWGGSSSIRSKNVIPDYHETAGLRIRTIHSYSGTQPGDPVKAAKLILEVVQSDYPPLHLPLGEFAIAGFREKMAIVENDIEAWEEKSRNTAF